MTRGRKTQDTTTGKEVTQQLARSVSYEAIDDAAQARAVVNDEAHSVAKAFGLQVRSIDEARQLLGQSLRMVALGFYQAGALLCFLKVLIPKGEWLELLEGIGINDRTAQRYMFGARKLQLIPELKRAEVAQLGYAKAVELVAHITDEEITELEEKGTVMELELDAYSRMSITEMRRKLRENEQQLEAKDKLLEKKDSKLNELQLAVDRKTKWVPREGVPAKSEAELQQLEALRTAHTSAYVGIDQMARVVRDMMDGQLNEALYKAAQDVVHMTSLQFVEIFKEFGFDPNLQAELTPEWMNKDLRTKA
jgi:hypothetical protein